MRIPRMIWFLFILGHFPSSFSSKRFVKVQFVQPYISTDTATVWKDFNLAISERLDFHTVNNLSRAVSDISKRILTSLTVDEILQPRNVKLSTNFRDLISYEFCFLCIHIELPLATDFRQTFGFYTRQKLNHLWN